MVRFGFVVNKSSSTQTNIEILKKVFALFRVGNIEDQHGLPDSSLFFFASWDLSNSSQYKQYTASWAGDIFKILNTAVKNIEENYQLDMRLWRVIGDEVVAYKVVTNYEDLSFYVDEIAKITKVLNDTVEQVLVYHNSDISIAFKCTAWLANVAGKRTNNADNSVCFYNIIDLSPERKIADFIGADIDAGFRLSKFGYKDVITISLELAFMLVNLGYNKIWLSKFEVLKGIHSDKPYPVLSVLLNPEIENFYSIIPYHYKYRNFDTEYCFDNIGYRDKVEFGVKLSKTDIERICKDLGILEKVETWKNKKSQDRFEPFDDTQRPELHCCAICYNIKTKKILVLKRSCSRKRYPGKWEFGCAKPTILQNIKDAIEDEYEKDIGCKINVIIDGNREDTQPVPIAIYSVYGTDKKVVHKGIIFLATINTDKLDVDKNKFAEYKFISKKEIDTFVSENSDNLIPDMEDSICKAFDFFNNRTCDGQERIH